jgi:hypothetical protein
VPKSQGNGEGKTSPRRLSAHDRQLRALTLRKGGASYDEIAAELGYSNRGGAYKAVSSALRETLREPADDVRALELDRLDHMMSAVWPAALCGDIAAQQQVLRLMERRAKYLGLDAPARVDIEARIRTVAEELGLDPDAAVAEAARILRESKV